MKYLWAGAAIVGVIAIVFGVVWMTVIFPKLERIPADFTRTDDFTGFYTVVDPLVSQVQTNASIQQLRNSPTTLQTLSDRSLQELLGSAAFQQLLANPAVIQQLLSNPAALQQADPAVRQILSNTSVQRLLADPVAQKLLADAAAIKLLMDPRTLGLLADPQALPVVKVPVQIHRERKATGADGDKLMLNEQVTTTRADTGQELVGYPKTNVNLVIDRRNSEYLEGTEGGRIGSLGLPFHVDKSKTYQVYVGAARAPLEAKYASTETVEGLELYVFKVDVKDRPMGTHPDLKLPLVADSTITLRAEPTSGRVVDTEDHATTVSVVHPQRGKLPLFISDIELTDASVSGQITEGKSDRTMLLWLGAYMPWIVLGVGIVLAVGGATGFAWTMKPKAQAATTPQEPHH